MSASIPVQGTDGKRTIGLSPKISLDLLRALAILLVLGRHSFSSGVWHWLGWCGVDLFFVISGFLVSGLIFGELSTTGNVRIGRFLARRALKIYPSFYLFLGVSLLAATVVGREYIQSQILSEVFYLQSYIEGMWMHTWSLSVEEHFYLLFAMICFIWGRRGFPMNFRRTMLVLIAVPIVLVLLRVVHCWDHRFEPYFVFTATHLRSDGIWMGIILAYSYHFGDLKSRIIGGKFLFLGAFVLGMLTIKLNHAGSFGMNTFGFGVVAIGFGGLLCLGLGIEDKLQLASSQRGILPGMMRGMSFIGRHSYSIYLWHLLADNVLVKAGLFDRFGLVYGETMAGSITIVFAIVLGIVMAQIIEIPILRWRNRVIA